jgi:HEAT repeat protein
MIGQPDMRTFLLGVAGMLVFAPMLRAVDVPRTTIVEYQSRRWPEGQGGAVGTVNYRPSQQEKSFFDRLPAGEVITGSHAEDYDISTKDNVYVGWFGIVRQIEEDQTGHRTVLTVEHKYFDGLTDAHQQTVSFNGAGDFRATLAGTDHRIPPLSLVKIYGTVTKSQDSVLPRVDAEFVRCWRWGAFAFISAYGMQRGNDAWRKKNQVALEEIYEAWPHPCEHYYEQRLGKRPDGPVIHKQLLDAAGSCSGDVHQAMERLADLLALGLPWSPAETMRQSEELRQINKAVEEAGSQKAAVNLLLQAMQENDERVSWSASETLVRFDPDGEAVLVLVQLLDSGIPTVRGGAAHALSYYGAKAQPAVAALSRCLTAADPELTAHAIRALAEIGPGAAPAPAALKSLLSDKNQEIRVLVARAIWSIDQQADDVIPVFVSALEHGDEGARYDAAERLKDMGPWAAPAVPALIRALKDAEGTNRCAVAEALGEIGREAAQAAPALVSALQHDEDDEVRSYAVESLGKIADPTTIPALIDAVASDDENVRFPAIEALERFGLAAKAAVASLMQAARDDESNGCFAAKALGSIDADGVSTPLLIELLGSEDSRMRQFAAFGLRRLGGKAGAAQQALHDRLTDGDPSVRVAVAEAYWAVSGKQDEAVQVLQSIIHAPTDGRVRMMAAGALSELGPAAKAAVPDLIPCLKDDNRYVVASSAKALGRIGPGAAFAVPALTARLAECDDHYTRVSIARALWRISGFEQSPSIFEDALRNSRDFMAVSAAAQAVGEMGPQARGIAPLLRPLLKDSDSFVRDAAKMAIEQIEQK